VVSFDAEDGVVIGDGEIVVGVEITGAGLFEIGDGASIRVDSVRLDRRRLLSPP
jgi:hypothetical protein